MWTSWHLHPCRGTSFALTLFIQSLQLMTVGEDRDGDRELRPENEFLQVMFLTMYI